MKKNYYRILNVMIFCFIVIYGFFKTKLLHLYSDMLVPFLEVFGVDKNTLLEALNNFSRHPKERTELIGWLIYYPTYLLLHLLFILLLYRKSKVIRNILGIGLICFVALLFSLSLVSKFLDIELLYQISYRAFQNLFTLPFILFFLEGGRVLYKDFIRLTDQQDTESA